MEPVRTRESLPPPASASVSHVRRRAPAACRVCRQRKVKCNVTAVGIPCLNCVRDGHSCEVFGRKRRADMRDEVDRETAIEADASTTMDLDSAVRERGPDDYAIESLASSIMENTAEATTETFYVGDQQGIGYILDIVGEPSVISQHYGLPYVVGTHDSTPQDVAYLRSKGVFSVPSEPVCQALLTAYFHHIHPILPVVDAAALLTTFRNGGASAVNLLLLWSMFSVAANYVDKAVVHQAGYQSHKEMKKSMFIRAKANRITIIQSVSLLAFWYSDLCEHTESWHWMGIAISLSQTLGLNRDPDRGQYNTRLSDRQRQLWRRIWWSCFFRDRWLSLGMGRPMRINARDCDTPMPSAEDLTNDFSELSPPIRAKYMPSDFGQLVDHWVVLLHLSKALGTILSENYCPTGPLPSRTWIEATEQELMRCIAQAGERPADSSPALSFYSYHLRLHFNAATIALWRPYSNRVATDVPSDQVGAWFGLVHQKIRIAAANTNTILDKIISDQLIGYIGPMTIPMLVPAMNSHLLESKSSDPLIRKSSLNKLNLFMMVLEKIGDVYSSAIFIHGLFLQAIEKLTSSHYTSANTNQHFSPRQNSTADFTGQDTLQDGIIQIPMDNFWQFDDQMSEFWDSLPTFSGTLVSGPPTAISAAGHPSTLFSSHAATHRNNHNDEDAPKNQPR
ncbi:C6 transcription factor [Ilyonectria destructans]|nr:C6 transcription factor [Ilyonectria destructans]